MPPPRGSRQSKHRSAVAQKGPARHLTCRRAPGAGLSHSCQIGRRVKLYGLLPTMLAVSPSKPPLVPAASVGSANTATLVYRPKGRLTRHETPLARRSRGGPSDPSHF